MQVVPLVQQPNSSNFLTIFAKNSKVFAPAPESLLSTFSSQIVTLIPFENPHVCANFYC